MIVDEEARAAARSANLAADQNAAMLELFAAVIGRQGVSDAELSAAVAEVKSRLTDPRTASVERQHEAVDDAAALIMTARSRT